MPAHPHSPGPARPGFPPVQLGSWKEGFLPSKNHRKGVPGPVPPKRFFPAWGTQPRASQRDTYLELPTLLSSRPHLQLPWDTPRSSAGPSGSMCVAGSIQGSPASRLPGTSSLGSRTGSVWGCGPQPQSEPGPSPPSFTDVGTAMDTKPVRSPEDKLAGELLEKIFLTRF